MLGQCGAYVGGPEMYLDHHPLHTHLQQQQIPFMTSNYDSDPVQS